MKSIPLVVVEGSGIEWVSVRIEIIITRRNCHNFADFGNRYSPKVERSFGCSF